MTIDHHSIQDSTPAPLPVRHIVHTWWPLAASWLLMAVEGPAMSAVVARLADPEINLAAWGGVIWPLALIIESPIIMLLSTSTALSKDWDSYLKLRRFMMRAAVLLTALHALIAFTPLYHVVTVELIGAPPEIIEPARLGLMIMTPWTWSIAYRRFNQGVLIRFGHPRAVGLGTLVRLSADGLVLAIGYLIGTNLIKTPILIGTNLIKTPILIGTVPGIVVATSAITTGVISEAIYAGLRVQPVLRGQLRQAAPAGQPLTLRAFMRFYTPLAVTSLLSMLGQPISSAALSRMPDALDSLAVWSVVSGFIFLLRSLGFAYNEVVIALLDAPRAARNLRRFAISLAALVTILLLTIAATPLASFWFGRVSALNPRLVALACRGLWVALPMPALSALQSWYQGTIVHSRRTRGITEAVAIFLLVSSAILYAGATCGQIAGLYVGLTALWGGSLAQTAWLWHRSRLVMQATPGRDKALSTV
jgi:hypothetical protein